MMAEVSVPSEIIASVPEAVTLLPETTALPAEKRSASVATGSTDSPTNPCQIKDNLENPKVSEISKDINILLLGCTGVGKSTFINSFANYLTFNDIELALTRNLLILIPSKIRIIDKNGKSQELKIGTEDKNEYIKTGEAQTQDVKTYVFPLADKNVNIRLIDTPGMGDPRGIKQDDINCENILNYIGNLKELHAICFLLKPNESRDTVFFKYCISQIFSRLDKSACDNIIFCFTNTRGTDYSPGETIDILKKNIEEVKNQPPHAIIPSDRNIFCFDNECFRYLAALKDNVELDDTLEERNIESWNKSVKECWKLIYYIIGDHDYPAIQPHNVRSTKAVNEARRIINRLAKPLADVAQLIQDNIYLLERHKENLSSKEKSLEEMKNQLYIPVNTLEIYPLNHPTTVCTTRKCADVTQIGGKNAWHYRQRCHEPCGLGGSVAKEIIGDPNLRDCAAMNQTGNCNACGCNFKVHMHVYYLTQQLMRNEVDPNIARNITTKEQLMQNKKIFLENLEIRQNELEQEHKVIIESSAKFAHFLQNNAITPFSDAYMDYIQYLITREKSMGRNCNADTVKSLERLLAEYNQLKNQFDEALKNARKLGHADVVNPQDINICLENLYQLKHNGPKIKELYEIQEREIIKYHKTKEYTHNKIHKLVQFVTDKLSGFNPFGKKKVKGEYKTEPENCFYDPYYNQIFHPSFFSFPVPPQHYPMPIQYDQRNRGVSRRNTFNGPPKQNWNDQQYRNSSACKCNCNNSGNNRSGNRMPSTYENTYENRNHNPENFQNSSDCKYNGNNLVNNISANKMASTYEETYANAYGYNNQNYLPENYQSNNRRGNRLPSTYENTYENRNYNPENYQNSSDCKYNGNNLGYNISANKMASTYANAYGYNNQNHLPENYQKASGQSKNPKGKGKNNQPPQIYPGTSNTFHKNVNSNVNSGYNPSQPPSSNQKPPHYFDPFFYFGNPHPPQRPSMFLSSNNPHLPFPNHPYPYQYPEHSDGAGNQKKSIPPGLGYPPQPPYPNYGNQYQSAQRFYDLEEPDDQEKEDSSDDNTKINSIVQQRRRQKSPTAPQESKDNYKTEYEGSWKKEEEKKEAANPSDTNKKGKKKNKNKSGKGNKNK